MTYGRVSQRVSTLGLPHQTGRRGITALAYILWLIAVEVEAGVPPESSRSRTAVQRATSRLTLSLTRQNLRLGSKIFIRIFKQDQVLEVWLQNESGTFSHFASYPICYFSGHPGPKLREGDRQSPEGFYSVGPASLNPSSRFHLSFNLGYPNAYDAAHRRTGGALMVHGDCVSIGCYAMTDRGIEEIYALAEAALKNNQSSFQVHIFPFRMIDGNFAHHRGSKWIPFWLNLKQGYDWFEKERVPPEVSVRQKQYVFRRSGVVHGAR